MKISIVYWSGTGNTEAMAKLIAEGAEGAEVAVIEVEQATAAVLESDVIAFGCPSMGAEVLEETIFEPYFTSIEGQLSGKKVALFGSYGWGDGEWMVDWTKRTTDAGAVLAAESLIVNEMPSGESADKCRHFGAAIAK